MQTRSCRLRARYLHHCDAGLSNSTTSSSPLLPSPHFSIDLEAGQHHGSGTCQALTLVTIILVYANVLFAMMAGWKIE